MGQHTDKGAIWIEHRNIIYLNIKYININMHTCYSYIIKAINIYIYILVYIHNIY